MLQIQPSPIRLRRRGFGAASAQRLLAGTDQVAGLEIIPWPDIGGGKVPLTSNMIAWSLVSNVGPEGEPIGGALHVR
jgi:hypothetical protein